MFVKFIIEKKSITFLPFPSIKLTILSLYLSAAVNPKTSLRKLTAAIFKICPPIGN